MKFAFAFVLLIGISCQIGQGDCAPDSVYESFKGVMNGVYSLTQDTYHSVIDHLSPLTDYLPSVPDSLTSYLPSTNSLTDGLSDIKESTENLGSEAGDMLKNGLDSTEDLGSDAGDMLKSGMDHISDSVNY